MFYTCKNLTMWLNNYDSVKNMINYPYNLIDYQNIYESYYLASIQQIP
jgi:hypothetical protein